MGRPKVSEEEKIYAYAASLRRRQIDWINFHPSFQVHKFFRDKLDQYIKKRGELL